MTQKKRQYTIEEIAKRAEVNVESIVDAIRNNERARAKAFLSQKQSKIQETEYMEMLVRLHEAKKALGLIDRERMELLDNIIKEVDHFFNTHSEEDKVSKPTQKFLDEKIKKMYEYFDVTPEKKTDGDEMPNVPEMKAEKRGEGEPEEK